MTAMLIAILWIMEAIKLIIKSKYKNAVIMLQSLYWW